jgi:nitroreductase
MADTTTQPNDSSARTYAQLEERFDIPLQEAMTTQRAVRRLLPDPVDDEIVLRCIELALKAPTGSNGQNWEFVVVKDRAVKEQLGRRYRQAWNLYHGVGEWISDNRGSNGFAAAAAKATGGATDDPESMRKIMSAVQWQVDHFADLPVLVIACLQGGRVPYVPTPAIQASSFYGSIYPSVQNLLLAARAVGLGASLITLPLWSMASARSILGLPISVTPACIVPLGWPRGRYGPTTRRAVGDVVHVDRYGNRPWPGRRLADT